jgi:hypothetical protein
MRVLAGYDVDPGARLSETGQGMVAPDHDHRLLLWKVWDPRKPLCGWCLLNPSTADAMRLDPTTQRITGFTARWGYGGWLLANLFTRRRTKPFTRADVPADPPLTVPQVFGGAPVPEPAWRAHLGADELSDAALTVVARRCPVVVAAWGNGGGLMGRDREAVRLLRGLGRNPSALGFTIDGHPVHPLARGRWRIPDDARPIPFPETPHAEADRA